MALQERNLLQKQINKETAGTAFFGLGTIGLVVTGLSTIINGVEHNDPALIGLGIFELMLAANTGTDFLQNLRGMNRTINRIQKSK
jgi:hypothetical protein